MKKNFFTRDTAVEDANLVSSYLALKGAKVEYEAFRNMMTALDIVICDYNTCVEWLEETMGIDVKGERYKCFKDSLYGAREWSVEAMMGKPNDYYPFSLDDFWDDLMKEN